MSTRLRAYNKEVAKDLMIPLHLHMYYLIQTVTVPEALAERTRPHIHPTPNVPHAVPMNAVADPPDVVVIPKKTRFQVAQGYPEILASHLAVPPLIAIPLLPQAVLH